MCCQLANKFSIPLYDSAQFLVGIPEHIPVLYVLSFNVNEGSLVKGGELAISLCFSSIPLPGRLGIALCRCNPFCGLT